MKNTPARRVFIFLAKPIFNFASERLVFELNDVL